MIWWHAVLLGLVEGITEYLPVSSTGHLILTAALLGLDTPEHKRSVDDFNVIIQGGAILAVLGLYWPRVLQMIRGLLGKDPAGFALLVNLFIAFLPAAILGVLLNKHIKAHLFHPTPVVLALALGGVFMIILDLRRTGRLALAPYTAKDITDLSPLDALKIGLLQCVAMWPGTSRSMMTISGGVLVGLRPAAAAEFSFLLGLPTLGAACLYDLAKNLHHSKRDGVPNVFEDLGYTNAFIGIAVAAISAAFAVRWLVAFLNRHGLVAFGVYRLLLAALLAALAASGFLTIAPSA